MNPSGKPIQISRQMVENEISVFKAKIALQKEMIAGHENKQVQERAFVKAVLIAMDVFAKVTLNYNAWSVGHRKAQEAQSAIFQFELASLEQQVAIREAMLREGERNVVVPGAFPV
jgi:hypothetical protein